MDGKGSCINTDKKDEYINRLANTAEKVFFILQTSKYRSEGWYINSQE